jgi:hypothetical protein
MSGPSSSFALTQWLASVPVVQFASSLIVAIIVAVLTVQLSLRRFYREKWWERRLDAYTRVIEALHHMLRSMEAGYSEELKERHYEPEQRKRLSERAEAGWNEVRKAADMGELLLSAAALGSLKDLIDQTDKFSEEQPSYFDYLNESLPVVRVHLKTFVVVAKKDLGLTPPMLDRVRRYLA